MGETGKSRMKKWMIWIRAAVRSGRVSFALFPVTQLSIWLGSLYMAILFSVDLPEEGLFFLFSLGSGAFFTEAWFRMRGREKIRDPFRWLLYLVSGIHGGLFTWIACLEAEGTVWGVETEILQTYVGRYALCYLLVLYLMAFYGLLRQSGMTPEAYLVHLFSGALRTGILYTILVVGCSMVLSILCSLFDVFFLQDFEIIMQAQCLLFGFVFLSGLLRCLIVPKDFEKAAARESLLEEALIKYVLTGLVGCVFVIIYAYVLKILVLRDMPSNEVFPILTALFVTGVPVWTMNSRYKEKNPLLGISMKMPYFFFPLIFLQGYCMGIRIAQNGITPSRYAGMAFLVFELLYLAVYHFRRQRLAWLLPAGAALIFVAVLLPGVNMYAVSQNSQRSDMERLLEKPAEQLTEDERLRLLGAYAYLEKDPDGKRYLASLTGERKEQARLLEAGEYGTEEMQICFQADVPAIPVDVEGFCRLYPLRENSRAEDETVIDLEGYTLTVAEGVSAAFDLEEYLTPCLERWADTSCEETGEEMDRWLQENQRIRLDENRWLQVNSLAFRYDLEREGYVVININGYLLEK